MSLVIGKNGQKVSKERNIKTSVKLFDRKSDTFTTSAPAKKIKINGAPKSGRM